MCKICKHAKCANMQNMQNKRNIDLSMTHHCSTVKWRPARSIFTF